MADVAKLIKPEEEEEEDVSIDISIVKIFKIGMRFTFCLNDMAYSYSPNLTLITNKRFFSQYLNS